MSANQATTGEIQLELDSHKLQMPHGHAGAVRRRSLLERLVDRCEARVVLLHGPAGHGKSTALQQLKTEFEARGVLTAWLSLDKADNDFRRFSIHFEAAASTLLHEGTLGRREPADAQVRQRRSSRLIARLQLLSRPVVLFFDDFQVIEEPLVLGFFGELFERLPEQVRIFVATRSLPEVGLARLLVNGHAEILRADALRFSDAEIAEFFSAEPKLALSAQELDTIRERSDGWPAALQLFRLALVSPQVRQSLGDLASYRPRELAEYLADNVLNLQPAALQDFLLKTSLLSAMTAPLCNAVTGRSDAQAVLLQLERAGLFVRSLGADLRWFRYHPLFSSFLAEQLQASAPDTALAVHRAAAQWCLHQGLLEETAHHALACGDTALAADTMAVWFARLIADGQLVTVEHWSSRLPDHEIAARPMLLVCVAYALVFLRRFVRLRPTLERLHRIIDEPCERPRCNPRIALAMAAISADDVQGAFELIDAIDVHATQTEAFNAFELAAAANLRGFRALARGEFEAARDDLVLARAHCQRGEASFSSGYTIGVRGISMLVQGELAEALQFLQHGLAEQRMHVDKSYASAAIVSCYLWALYEANQLDRVEALFGRYHDIIAASVLPDFLAVAYLAMARTHDARGRNAQAVALLEEAETLAHSNGWTRVVAIVGWERLRRALLAGSASRVQAMAAQLATLKPAPTADWILFSEDFEGPVLGAIRLAIHRRQHEEAAQRIAAEFPHHPDRGHRQIRLHLLEAQLHESRGLRNAAHRSLRQAMQRARPGGFVRLFLDEGESVLALLREAYQSALDANPDDEAAAQDRDFLETLLQASGIDLSRRPARGAAPVQEALTEREKEILGFLANGISNREMASRAFLSENTVKFHLKNIYSKLEVRSRMKAIAAARQRGLIH